ncbi:MAG: hypothetical protein KC645_17620 [Gemmatimonadetes bacterium]|nr:hypothetical protein [Gemmatimonadota bacterium]
MIGRRVVLRGRRIPASALFGAALLLVATVRVAEGQSRGWAPDQWRAGIGIGEPGNRDITVGTCDAGVPLFAAAGPSWHLKGPLRIELEAGVLGSGFGADCATDAAPCEPGAPCLRSEGLETPLWTTTSRLVVERTLGRPESRLRLSGGVGHFWGAGVWYRSIGGGVRLGDPTGLTATVELERWFFDASERRYDIRDPTGALYDVRRRAGRLMMLRVSVS